MSEYKAALLSVNETIKFLNVGRTTLYELCHKGQLYPRKIGGRTVFERIDLEKFIQNLPYATLGFSFINGAMRHE